MRSLFSTLALWLITTLTSLSGDKLKVESIHMYSNIYPAAHALSIPFNGYVKLNRLPKEKAGEYWLNVDHLIDVDHFKNVHVLVDHEGVIIGGKATFDGTREAWTKRDLGVQARLKVIAAFVGGEEDFYAKMKQPIQLYNAHGDFGGMVFTFHTDGVSWRKHHKMRKTKQEYEALEKKIDRAHQPVQ